MEIFNELGFILVVEFKWEGCCFFCWRIDFVNYLINLNVERLVEEINYLVINDVII